MNSYKVIFILLFIWCSIYNISLSADCFRTRKFFQAINALVFQITAIILCTNYVFR